MPNVQIGIGDYRIYDGTPNILEFNGDGIWINTNICAIFFPFDLITYITTYKQGKFEFIWCNYDHS